MFFEIRNVKLIKLIVFVFFVSLFGCDSFVSNNNGVDHPEKIDKNNIENKILFGEWFKRKNKAINEEIYIENKNAYLDSTDKDKKKILSELNGYKLLLKDHHNFFKNEKINADYKDNHYIYSIVYKFKDKNKFEAICIELDNANITDKWAGFNRKTNMYYIYTGSFFSEKIAIRRVDFFSSITGIKPSIELKIKS